MLASLRATLPPGVTHEIIFVDDGSTDGTREWLATLGGYPFSILLNDKNLGYAAANNRGAAQARGNLLVLLNNDLVLTPNWLEPMLAVHRSLANPGAIGNIQLNFESGQIDHAGIFINAKGKPEHDRTLPTWGKSRQIVAATTGACLLLERTLWNDLGGFDDGFINGCEDIDLCLRAHSRRRENAVALKSIVYHHVSASPGRKRRDEANTQRLTKKWRDDLVSLGATAWCREYVSRELNGAAAFCDPIAALQIWSHAMGLLNEPPPVAIAAMQSAIDRELERWRQLLGDRDNEERRKPTDGL